MHCWKRNKTKLIQFVCCVYCVSTCLLFHSWLNLWEKHLHSHLTSLSLGTNPWWGGKEDDLVVPVHAVYYLVPEFYWQYCWHKIDCVSLYPGIFVSVSILTEQQPFIKITLLVSWKLFCYKIDWRCLNLKNNKVVPRFIFILFPIIQRLRTERDSLKETIEELRCVQAQEGQLTTTGKGQMRRLNASFLKFTGLIGRVLNVLLCSRE